MNDTPHVRKLPPEEEAAQMLAMRGGEAALPACLDVISQQLNVIQARSQLLLTLSTLTLTITGFSGPQIARTNVFARTSIVIGVAFVLSSTVVILLGGLRIRWVTQITAGNALSTLSAVIRYRNVKSNLYGIELFLIVIGLISYVCSLVTYLLSLR